MGMDLSVAQLGVIFVLALMAIAFGQSAWDKVADFKGNLAWLEGHFAKSPFARSVRPMLVTVALAEAISAALCLVGIGEIVVNPYSPHQLATGAMIACAVTLLMLFTGQRVAKDYPGAATLATYGLLVLGGFFGLHLAASL
jgi:hypothetical protein